MQKFGYCFQVIVILFVLSCSKQEEFKFNQMEVLNEDFTNKAAGEVFELHKNNVVQADALLRGWSDKRKCLRGYGNCALAIVDENYMLQENAMPITLELISHNQMKIINKISKTNEDGNALIFSNNFVLPASLAAKLNKVSIVILEGTYPIENIESNGEIIVMVAVN